LIAELPVSVRFSTLAASVWVTEASTRSVPSPAFSVIVMPELLPTMYVSLPVPPTSTSVPALGVQGVVAGQTRDRVATAVARENIIERIARAIDGAGTG